MIKPPAGEGSNAPLAGDDEPVNVGNAVRFGWRLGKGFFPFAVAGNDNVAIFTTGLW
jgi:hypothetical protein